jgi:hypothetical protein
VLWSFRLQRFYLHHKTFPLNAKLDNSLNDASPESQDCGPLDLWALEDLSTQSNIFPNAKFMNLRGLVRNYAPGGATWKKYGDDMWPNQWVTHIKLQFAPKLCENHESE